MGIENKCWEPISLRVETKDEEQRTRFTMRNNDIHDAYDDILCVSELGESNKIPREMMGGNFPNHMID